MPESIRAREKRIAAASYSSSTPSETITGAIGLPNDVAGLVIVDVGSGASSMVRDLRARGAEAYGVDPGYKNVDALLRTAGRYIRGLGVNYGADALKVRLQALAEFQADFRRNKGHYKTALAGDLPFKDDSVDIVYSELAISHFLIREDREVFMGAVDEGLRVLKPAESGIAAVRRSLVLHPWRSPQAWTPAAHENGNALEASLRARSIPFFVEPVEGGSPRLRIVKP
jgi:ubiquinone/menaquinone biosynthesis C-methylase UbiE